MGGPTIDAIPLKKLIIPNISVNESMPKTSTINSDSVEVYVPKPSPKAELVATNPGYDGQNK